jgi:outer membrane protein assembly factor BamB
MKINTHNILPILCALIASLLAIWSLVWWMDRPVALEDITLNEPGLDQVPPGARDQQEEVRIGEFFERFEQSCDSALTGEWPRFRGKDATNIARDQIRLADNWQATGPPVLWTKPLGEGHAAPVIYKGQLYILDYLEEERADALRCFCLLSGRELWRRWYNVDIKRNHGRSRTIPAVNADHVITIGPKGHVMCVNRQNGALRWGLDLVKDFGATIPQWYTGQCPLLDDGIVVLAPGGPEALLIGVDALSGEVQWTSPNLQDWKMSHSSIMPMTLNGRKMYVYFALGGVVGVAADGEQAGQILWQTDTWSPAVVAPSPVILDKGRIFLTAGYGAGSLMMTVEQEGETFHVKTGQQYRPREALSLEQQSPIYYQGTLFGIMPKDAGIHRKQLVGSDPDDITQFTVPGDNEWRFGLGPFIIADDKFFVLDDDGTLSMLVLSENRFQELDRYKVLEGPDAWGPIAIADGLMLLRDSTTLVCLDLTLDKRWKKHHR